MRVGITMRSDHFPHRDEYVDGLSREWPEFLDHTFSDIAMVPILNSMKNVTSFLNHLKLGKIILTGGNDIGSDEKRDSLEVAVMRYATENRLPTLCICRGFQLMNIFFGGEISKNISSTATIKSHVNTIHSIRLLDKRFEVIAGKRELKVNSYHDHGIFKNDLSKKLNIFAMTEDDLIEGIYHPKLPIIGVQWHFERENPAHRFDTQIIKMLFNEGMFWETVSAK